jgi:hypothetical protein
VRRSAARLSVFVPSGDDFRAIALALPEAEERETWGHATFRVRDTIWDESIPRSSASSSTRRG